jgi:2-aminoadipate transaminase
MNWNNLYAKRTRWMSRSAIREVLKVTAQREIISFAGGLPAADLFPLDRVSEAATRVLKTIGPSALQYSQTEGIGGLRAWIAGKFHVQRENVLITSGSQQALDLIGRVIFDEGDRAMVESPTYLALLSAWRPLGVEFVPAPSDADGMQVDQLEALLQQQKPKCIYLTPNFQNPQGTTLPQDRRIALLEFARKHSIAIVEDNPYSELRYRGASLPHLFDLEAGAHAANDGVVIHVGTFSKVLMPGLRIGWVVAASPLIDKLVLAKQAADLHTSAFNQHIALELATNGCMDELIPRLRQAYRERLEAMLAALEKHFPRGASWTSPDGGIFLLATLPRSVNTTELLPAALEQNVAFVPGEEFHLNGEGRNTLRLNFSNATPEKINAGIARLAEVFKQACCSAEALSRRDIRK